MGCCNKVGAYVGGRVVELMSRLAEEWKDVQTHKTDRTGGISEWVDESTDYSKAKETRHIGVSTRP
jgi:hypothetical protein